MTDYHVENIPNLIRSLAAARSAVADTRKALTVHGPDAAALILAAHDYARSEKSHADLEAQRMVVVSQDISALLAEVDILLKTAVGVVKRAVQCVETEDAGRKRTRAKLGN